MKITVDIPEDLLSQAIKVTSVTSPSPSQEQVVIQALQGLIRKFEIAKLIECKYIGDLNVLRGRSKG
jgi:hypothetical protein